VTCTTVSGKNYSDDGDTRVSDGHYTASRICDITSEKIKFFTVKTVRTLNDSSYNLINNSDCLHYCDVNTGNFFIFLLQFNTLHTSHSNNQSPVHYFGLIHFILQTQICAVLCITSFSYPRQKPKFPTHRQNKLNTTFTI
jgi:magnesium-transporting ATPase (P-type)